MIKGSQLRDAFISGANRISNCRQQVDALNVFPVPDGDTGTNMSMTINAAKRELELLKDEPTVEQVSKKAASALLRGARGNSGVILSLLPPLAFYIIGQKFLIEGINLGGLKG